MNARALFALSLAVLTTRCAKDQVYEKPLTPVSVARVASVNTGAAVRYSATVKPALEVTVAFKVGGYVDNLLSVRDDRGRARDVQPGDHVTRGVSLARIRPSDYQQRVAQAGSGLAEAEAMHESARLDFERSSRLYERRSLTKPELDAASARVDAAAARVSGSRAMVSEAQILLDDATLRSPIDGVVLKRDIENGTLAVPGQAAFVLADTTAVKVTFGVPDVVVKDLRIGRAQRIAFEALKDETFDGRITSIAPSPDPVSRVYQIDVTIPNPHHRIEVGFIASLQLEDRPGRTVPVVPLEAIVKPPNRPEEYAVFVLEDQKEGSVAHLRPVTLGDALGDVIAVTGGLSAGQQIVVRGATLVSDGERVRRVP
jgi:RND family efflux transporter MFP subunit